MRPVYGFMRFFFRWSVPDIKAKKGCLFCAGILRVEKSRILRVLLSSVTVISDFFFFFSLSKQVYDRFVARVTELAGKLRQGPVLGKETVDCGAMVMPAQLDIVQVRCVAPAAVSCFRCSGFQELQVHA